MIYLIDTIGKETGMHLYDEAFRRSFKSKGVDVVVLSNFEDENTIPIISNFYHGNIIMKLYCLFFSYIRLFFFYQRHRNGNIFIYQSFGLRFIDELFIRIFRKRPNLYVIVHDIFDIKTGKVEDPRREHKINVYNNYIPHIISHSRRTENDLKKIGYRGNIIYFPHFSYNFNKNVIWEDVGEDIKASIESDRINYLFFGQVRMTKGIDVLIDSFYYIPEDIKGKINIIIAGQDKTDIIASKQTPLFVKKNCRYVNDSELNYLFERVDYILLPYKEIYQSGVLEAVIYFKKPAIMSNIGYFKFIKKEYPSFGLTYEPNNGSVLAENIVKTAISHNNHFYTKEDMDKYKMNHDPSILVNQLVNN